jgi:endonuclease I
MKKYFILLAMATILSNNTNADVGDLLVTEISVTPFGAEFIEIYNNGGTTVDLSDVYLTDATYSPGGSFYYKIVTGYGGGGDFSDFNSRFPNGASIDAGEYQTVALNGSTEFFSAFSQNPTYELFEDGSSDGIPDMREATSGSINDQGGLTNSKEVVILYTWNGVSDLVQDIDYITWGSSNHEETVDKTGVAIDSLTDADSNTSTYLPDTAIASQPIVDTGAHAEGMTWQRNDLTEGTETKTGGNSVLGHNETSENTNVTFSELTPTPNAATGTPPPPDAPNILINEVDAVGTAEFIELFGTASTSLDDVKVVLFDGATDQVYAVYDLSAESTDMSGYFLIANATIPSPDVTLPVDGLQDGADAVAIYFTSDVIDTSDTLTTLASTPLLDAFVYGSGDADDAELLDLLNGGQAQVDEDFNGLAADESNARCINGSGGAFNTVTYQQVVPTPGLINSLCDDSNSAYYASITPGIIAVPDQLRTALHNLIDDHTPFPYSGGGTDACDIIEDADEDPSNANDVWMLYSNYSYADAGSCAGSYNREHTWPKSRFTGTEDSIQGRDTHHLMATDAGYNTSRGARYFDNCIGGLCSKSGLTTELNNGVGGDSNPPKHGDHNWRNANGNIFEVWDYRKGDVARAMFYMDVRYEGDSGEPDLQLTDDINILENAVINYMGRLTTLCEWHFADPVDANDIWRNDVVFAAQQNRNPFVDHPEWASKVFAECAAVDPAANDLIFESGFE